MPERVRGYLPTGTPDSASLPALLSPGPGLLAAASMLLLFVGLWNHELWGPDEPRVAGIGREMWQSGAVWVPRLTGLAFMEQPPLYYWSQAAIYSLFGRADAGLARLPSALFALGTLAATYGLGRRYFTRAASGLAGLVLLTTSTFLARAHWVVVDSALVFGVTAALACFARIDPSLDLEVSRCTRLAWIAAMTASLGLGFMAKGVVGIGIPVLGIGVYLIGRRRLLRFLPTLILSGLGVGALVGIWLWGVFSEEGASGVRAFLLDNQLGRLVSTAVEYRGGHVRPWHFYLTVAPQQFLPWTPLGFLAAVGAWRQRRRLREPGRESERAGLELVLAVFVPSLLVLSVASTKRGLYLLPLAPCLALAVGWWLACDLERSRIEVRIERIWRWCLLVLAALFPLVAFGSAPSQWGWSLMSVGLGALALVWERWHGLERSVRWSGSLTLLCVGVFAGLHLGPPMRDVDENVAPVVHDMDRLVARAPLCALRPSENLRGLVAFYTDRELCIFSSVEEVRARALASAGWWLAIEGGSSEQDGPGLLDQAHIAYDDHRELRGGGEVFHLVYFAGLPRTTDRTREASP